MRRENHGVLEGESEKENGPFASRNRRVLVFSIGAGNESHGGALPSNIDDYAAIVTATTSCMRLGLTYIGHLPYSSDRAGAIAKDWNPGYISREELTKRVSAEIKRAIRIQESLGNEASLVVLVSGHGGNNLLQEEEARLSEQLGIPFHYIPPFPGGSSIRSKRLGRIETTHADHGEHSIGLYLGVLDDTKLRHINRLAGKDPSEALKQNPAIMGLGYYVLPEFSGERYEDLRRRHKELFARAQKFINHDKQIIADYEAGKLLMDKNVRDTVKRIRHLVG